MYDIVSEGVRERVDNFSTKERGCSKARDITVAMETTRVDMEMAMADRGDRLDQGAQSVEELKGRGDDRGEELKGTAQSIIEANSESWQEDSAACQAKVLENLSMMRTQLDKYRQGLEETRADRALGKRATPRERSKHDMKPRSNCFLCDGLHWARDCPRRKSLNAMLEGRDVQEQGRSSDGKDAQVMGDTGASHNFIKEEVVHKEVPKEVSRVPEEYKDVSANQTDWERILDVAQSSHNSQRSESTNRSLVGRVTGQQPLIPQTLLTSDEGRSSLVLKVASNWHEQMGLTRPYHRKATIEVKKGADTKRRRVEYNDRVFVKVLPSQHKRTHRLHKGYARGYERSFPIMKKPTHEDEKSASRKESRKAPSGITNIYEEVVESILAERAVRSKKNCPSQEYLVKWKGLPDGEAIWELASNKRFHTSTRTSTA